MKNIILLFIIIFSSCNSKNESKSKSELTYRMLIKENNRYNFYLAENIKNKITGNTNNKKIVDYDKLTKDYLNYLSDIEIQISKKSTEIFFKNDEYSSIGKEFIDKTKKYKTGIEKLAVSENLKKRINLILNTNDIQMPDNGNDIVENNENGEIKSGKIYFKYLDYYYRQIPNNQSLSFLNNKKRSILEIENEFIE